jgi:uncharacterized protein YaaQ
MKLILTVVNRRDMRTLHDALLDAGHRFTEISSTGGLLGAGNVTLLMGVEVERVDEVVALVRGSCRSREEAVSIGPPDTRLYADTTGASMTVPVGGAQLFVLNIERVEHV